jgi:hypothetical protein
MIKSRKGNSISKMSGTGGAQMNETESPTLDLVDCRRSREVKKWTAVRNPLRPLHSGGRRN